MIRVVLLAVLLGAGRASDPAARLTPAQARWIAASHAAAEEQSLKAERDLLETLDSTLFKVRLAASGSTSLAALGGSELLRRLKAALRSMEWSFNFGIDEATQRRHPGETAMNLTTVELYGHIPNMWELKASGDAIASQIPDVQWAVMDAAEHNLLGFPSIGGPPYNVTTEQALMRPQYANGNTRRIDTGVQRYGSYSAVLRNDVMRARAVTNGVDSGAWEDVCNKSSPLLKPYFHALSLLAECDALVNKDSRGHQILGSTDHMLHTLVSNYNVLGKLGGGLPRLLYQMLEKGATFAPFESLFYVEGLLLAPPRPDELKLVVASFPDIFGTADAEALRDFCMRWKVPLAWGLGGGRPFSAEEADAKEWIPESPFARWPVAADRLLDLTAWDHTNATSVKSSINATVWYAVEMEAKRRRADGSNLTHDIIVGWWQKLIVAGAPLRQLVGSECHDIDFCFGTIATRTKDSECVCALVGNEDTDLLV